VRKKTFVFDLISALRDEIVCQDRLGTDTQKENLNKWYRMRAQNVFAYDGCVQNRGDKGALSLMYSMEFFSEIDHLAKTGSGQTQGVAFKSLAFFLSLCLLVIVPGGIAILCPGGHKPDGTIANNEFFSCPNVR
jgi:hypothetical protein